MRTRLLLPLMLSLLPFAACSGGGDDDDATDSATPGDDDTTPTATPTATPSSNEPSDFGFEFDGATYPLTEDAMYCQPFGTMYNFSSGALRDGTGPQANGYAYFDDIPAPGAYSVVHFSFSVDLTPGQAAVAILDTRDSVFWYSSGTAGTLEVSDAGGGALDVVWHDVAFYSDGGGTQDSEVGWLQCTP